MRQFSIRNFQFPTLAVQCCLFLLIVVSSGTNAMAQCSFNIPSYFDPDVFPEFPMGTDGNNYKNEGEALGAAKRAIYGPSGTYPVTSVADVCKGYYISSNLSLAAGGSAGEIPYDGGAVRLADLAKNQSLLVFSVQRGFCAKDANGNLNIVSTRDSVYTNTQVLSCTEQKSLQLTFSGLNETRPAGTGGTSTVSLTAKVTSGGTATSGVALSFSAEVASNSGGHDHDVSRPKGTLSATQGVTDTNGEVKLAFQAPLASGAHTLKVNCVTCSNPVVSKDIQVKVPNLVEMLPDTAKPPTYTLVGATGNHRSNHWFSSASVVTLGKVADAMFKTGWGAVGVNDGSLVWGGLFDIKGGWTPSHHEHRVGTEVDLSVTNPRNVTDEQKKKTYAELCKKNNTAFSIQTLWHQDDGYPEHFHMYLDGTGLYSQAQGGPCCARYKTTRAKLDKNGNPVLDKNGKPVQENVALCEETSPR